MGGSRNTLRTFFSPPFVVALLFLGSAAFLAEAVGSWLGYTRVKSEIGLRRSLHLVDEMSMGAYKVRRKTIHSPEAVNTLGTDKYLSWSLEDTAVGPGDPLRFAQVDVTYYTGGGDLAPHTPDVCVAAQGYRPVELANRTIDLPVSAPWATGLPVRVCTFEKTNVFENERFSVVYTFYCNGRFVNTSYGVRDLIRDPQYHYAFFSKVEVTFHGVGPLGFVRPGPEDTVRGAARLLGTILPTLIENHYPDFEAAEAAVRNRKAPSSGAAKDEVS